MDARIPPRWLLVGLTSVVLLAGCASGDTPAPASSPAVSASPSAVVASPAPTATPAPSPAPSSTAAQTGSGSVRLTLPANWSEVELTEAGLRSMVSGLQGSNPEFAAYLTQLLDTGAYESFRLWAYGYDGAMMMGSVNVTEEPAQGNSLDSVEPLLTGMLKQMPTVSGVASRRISLPVGEALLFSADQTTTMADGSTFAQTMRSYLVVKDDVLYSINFTCTPQAPEACLRDVEAMIETLAIGQ